MGGKTEIIAINKKHDLAEFLELPYRLYRGQANWIAPLKFERKALINRNKNPGLANIDFQFFLAKRDGETIGRIAAIWNKNHQKLYNDNQGHFGFLDCVEEENILRDLFAAAENWLKIQGAKTIAGPLSFSIYEEAGLLVDGFDTPPFIMMPYGRPFYAQGLKNLGFEKATDLFAYFADMHAGYPRPKIVQTMLSHIKNDKNITVRPMLMGKFLQEVQMAMEIFNDAWSDNWGHLPLSGAQIKHMANELKPIIRPDFFWVCEYRNEPAAFILMVPNINEAIFDLHGKLLPFGWAKLLYRLKIKGIKTARIPLMGVKREFQRKKSGLAMAAFLSEKAFEMGRNAGFTHVEMSWILENNKSMIRIIEQAQGKAYKTYRIYEKSIL